MKLFNRGDPEADKVIEDLDRIKRDQKIITIADPPSPSPGVLPPSRNTSNRTVTPNKAMGLATLYRAIQLHSIAAKQCGIHAYKDGVRTPWEQTPQLIKKPALGMTRSAWVERSITSLARYGFAARYKVGLDKENPVELRPLDPRWIRINLDEQDPDRIKSYGYRDKTYSVEEISHIKYLDVDGYPSGLGPIQADREGIAGMIDTRDYARNWLDESGIPPAVLSSDQPLFEEQIAEIRSQWHESNGGRNGIAVLGQGAEFQPIFLNPVDIQWLESQKYDDIEICRLLGAPASVMLVSLEGNSQTYSNVEQDWINYVRFGLMTFLLPIEEELAEHAPGDDEAHFNTDSLLRSDTLTRTQAIMLATGNRPILTPDEGRALENRAPFTEQQKAELGIQSTPTPFGGPNGNGTN